MLGKESVLEVDGRGADEVVGRRQVVVPDLYVEPRAHREHHVELEQASHNNNNASAHVRNAYFVLDGGMDPPAERNISPG